MESSAVCRMIGMNGSVLSALSAAHDFEAVDARHHHVEQDQIGRRVGNRCEGLLAIHGGYQWHSHAPRGAPATAQCCLRDRRRSGFGQVRHDPLSRPRNRCTSATTARGSHGFARYPSQPTSIAFSRSEASACAVSAMIGMSLRGWVVLQNLRRFPPVDDRNRDVHQDQVRPFSCAPC